MRYFTILFFLLCLRFTTHTYKQEHIHKSPHFPPNPFNLFTDISHFESFHLFPSSTLSVSPHLLLFINSSIRFRPRSSYPPSLFPSPQSWNTHSPSSGWWCWAESWPVSSELYSPQCTINPELSEIIFTPQLSCWSPHGYPLTQWNMAPTYRFWQFRFISGTSWLFNLTLSSSHWSRWWSCSHFSIIPEIQSLPLSKFFSTWIFWTHDY